MPALRLVRLAWLLKCEDFVAMLAPLCEERNTLTVGRSLGLTDGGLSGAPLCSACFVGTQVMEACKAPRKSARVVTFPKRLTYVLSFVPFVTKDYLGRCRPGNRPAQSNKKGRAKKSESKPASVKKFKCGQCGRHSDTQNVSKEAERFQVALCSSKCYDDFVQGNTVRHHDLIALYSNSLMLNPSIGAVCDAHHKINLTLIQWDVDLKVAKNFEDAQDSEKQKKDEWESRVREEPLKKTWNVACLSAGSRAGFSRGNSRMDGDTYRLNLNKPRWRLVITGHVDKTLQGEVFASDHKAKGSDQHYHK
jgi:hypothetical protein